MVRFTRSSVGRIERLNLAEQMASSPHHWFVQTDFGALLGPMPDDALAEMARTGALLDRDRVREGSDGEWRLASEVPGLFDEQTPSLGLLSSTLEDMFAPETPSPRESTISRNALRKTPTKTNESSVSGTSQELEFEIDEPLIAPPPAVQPPPVTKELDFEIDVSPVVPKTAVAESSAAQPISIQEPPLNVSTSQVTEPPQESVPPAPTPSIREPEPVLSAPSGWQARSTSTSRWQPTTKRSSRGWQSDKQLWLTGAIAATVLMVLVGVWWFWPRQRPDLYKSYLAIYQELQQRRETSEDYARWTDFVKQSKSQLAATVPWLEENSRPGDREKSLLLYAGRDLQELLELPRTSKSPHQKRLDAFFEQLQEIYGSK